MHWNWKNKDWPNFRYSKSKLAFYEKEFLYKAGELLGAVKHVDREGQTSLKLEIICDEAMKTSEIEGEYLNRESLQSSIRNQFGMQTNTKKIPPAELGISEIMYDLYVNYALPLNHQKLFNWHELLTMGRSDLVNIGGYRTFEDPMQVISGPVHRPIIHFEAPPSSRVKREMDDFVEWFNRTETDFEQIGILERAGIAHLYFESIHPFEDGNGRIGRVISEKALSQRLKRPTLIALSVTIEKNKSAYYAALEANNKSLEIDGWFEYFCEMVLDAQENTLSMVDFLFKKAAFYEKYAGKLNERQQKAVKRIFEAGISGFKGGLSAKNYISITGASPSTATRDLQYMLNIGAFKKTGELKGTRYYLNIDHPSASIEWS